jgi:hypothetical protein
MCLTARRRMQGCEEDRGKRNRICRPSHVLEYASKS